ncbi:VanW family protein [Brevibacillus sp. M2.1A]|uniref:VanW family protein n=2 Tax=Brevibacillus TaxID=55080 RepID=UPI00156BB821|nr:MULTISPECIES: VanW family protein [Brevibacillus]MBY0084290.1 VanW family protein [Brevibacillus brevis]MCC8436165.1 VanW family protein [Brevibacillus sp. M2.1A]
MKKVRHWPITMAIVALVFSLGMNYAPEHAMALQVDHRLSPAIELQDKLQEKYVEKMGLKEEEVLGFYYSSMKDSTDARKHNIKQALSKIHNEKIKPQQVFSFNEIVGNSNLPVDGWQQAGVIQNGQLVDDYGGGVCQVSSTLYNAVAEAGMIMVERHNHSKSVRYVPVGQDATVAYGYKDFKFTNLYDFPVKIKAKSYDDEHVVIAIIRA